METITNPNAVLVVESRHGLLEAEFLPQKTDWMIGNIPGRQFEGNDQRYEIARAVIDSLEAVSESELLYSSCTDGRGRISLADGGKVPIREQGVGADMMELFIMAEALGPRFYKDPTAPVESRLREVIGFAKSHEIMLSTHYKCGAAGGFTTVINNSSRFVDNPSYTERQSLLIGAELYDENMHREIAHNHQRRLDAGLYEGYSSDLVTELVMEMVGPHAVEEYKDDGRGVGGHMELLIARLAGKLKGVAINPNGLASRYGVQVFGINAGRVDRLARLFSMGGRNDPDYRTALIAGEDFASAGHGTLATGMETMIIRKGSAS